MFLSSSARRCTEEVGGCGKSTEVVAAPHPKCQFDRGYYYISDCGTGQIWKQDKARNVPNNDIFTYLDDDVIQRRLRFRIFQYLSRPGYGTAANT